MRKTSLLLGAALIVLTSIGSAQADDNMIEIGAEFFSKKCSSCHAVGEGAKNKVGPVLTNIIGRKAASYEGFKYSDPMKAKADAGLVWTDATLTEFLTKPSKYIRGTRMTFRGIKKKKHKKHMIPLIAYLNSLVEKK